MDTHMATLLDHGLHHSAQLLGHFLVSVNSDSNSNMKPENLLLLGDAFFREKEYRRALNTYKQALHHHKTCPKQNASTLRGSLSTPNRSSSPSPNISTVNENEVKFKIASCHAALHENKIAVLEMEGIPSKARNLPMNLMMGKLYRHTRHIRAAVACYKDCLRQCPYVLEAIVALAELGASAKEIIVLLPQTPSRSGRPLSDHLESGRWLQRYVEAQCCIAINDYKVYDSTDAVHFGGSNLHLEGSNVKCGASLYEPCARGVLFKSKHRGGCFFLF